MLPKHNFIKQDFLNSPSTAEIKLDPTFKKIIKNSIAFHVWLIEDEHLEPVSKSSLGTFQDDTAYIVYASSTIGNYVNQDTITREVKSSTILERFLHYWIGREVSELKRNAVVQKLQELDSFLGNTATQYRETQDNESPRFLSYFKKGLNIRCSITRTCGTNRLYQCRGRKWLRCIEMDTISWQHFNSEYVLLLKTDAYIFAWIGRSSSLIERTNSLDLALKYVKKKTELVIVDDGYEQSMPEKAKVVWNALLPLTQRSVWQTSEIVDKKIKPKFKIYKCTFRGNRLHLDQLDVVIPTKDDLSDSTKTYVLDGFDQGVWMWVGNQVPKHESVITLATGRAFIKKKKYPSSTAVVRVVEDHEPIEFTRLFPMWHNEWNETPLSYQPVSTHLGNFDSVSLCQRPKMAADTQLIDDGSGERKIYQITRDQVIELPVSKLILFSTCKCYVVHYKVVCATTSPIDAQNVGIDTIIYQWIGSEAIEADIGKCERFAKSSFEKQTGKAMFVQMCEFDETPHFLQMFDGKLIILLKDIPYDNNNDKKQQQQQHSTLFGDDKIILKMYGNASYNSKAVEVYPMSSLSSKECYVIKTNHVWIWCGQNTTGDAREVAKVIGTLLGESSLIMEGKEPKEFWHSISNQLNQPLIANGLNSPTNNGSNISNSTGTLSSSSSCRSNGTNGGNLSPSFGSYLISNVVKTRPQPQLHLIWSQQNRFCNQEIMAYDQNDLSPECVFVLDASCVSYIWLGDYAIPSEREHYISIAQYYFDTVPIARRPTTAICIIKQNGEPNCFKGFFENWNDSLWRNFVCYEQRRQTANALFDIPTSNGGSSNRSSPLPSINSYNNHFDKHHKYPLKLLQMESDMLPTEVNPLKKELHLTNDDFVSIFKMSYWEFEELPSWKKQELKKKYKLF